MTTSIDWKPSERKLAGFSEAWLFFVGMIGAPWWAWRGFWGVAAVFWVLAVLVRGVGLWRPSYLKPLFVGMTLVSWPIGVVVSWTAMALFYFGVITPVAIVFRLIGRDALKRKFDRDATTYWEAYRADHGGSERYLKQF